MSEINNSVIKAMMILDLFMDEPSLNITEIQKASGLSRAAITRILNSLLEAGYINKDMDSSKYCLGNKVFFLANSKNKYANIINLISKPLEELSKKVGHAISVTVLENYKNVSIFAKQSKSVMGVLPKVGSINELNNSASGKIHVAYNEEGDKIIDNINFIKKTENTITTKEEFKRVLEKVKQDGYATDNEELEKGLFCISMPVFDRNDTVVCAVSVSGYKGSIMENFDTIKKDLKECTNNISKDFH